GSWDAEASGRARRGLGENRGGVSQLIGAPRTGLDSFLNYIVALGISDVRWFAEAPGSPGSSPAQPCGDRNGNFKQGLWTAEAGATRHGGRLSPCSAVRSTLPLMAVCLRRCACRGNPRGCVRHTAELWPNWRAGA